MFGIARLIGIHAQQNKYPASHVLAKKISGISAGNQYRLVRLIRLHVDTDAVANILAYMDSSTAHAVAENIAGMTMDHNFTGVHGITDVILGIFVDDNGSSVHKSSQVIAGNAVNGDSHRLIDAVADKILAIDVIQFNCRFSRCYGITDRSVQFVVVNALRINLHTVLQI